jgi:hypothetical protein
MDSEKNYIVCSDQLSPQGRTLLPKLVSDANVKMPCGQARDNLLKLAMLTLRFKE